MAQLNITISEYVSFMKIPSSCTADRKNLLCDITNGSPLFKDTAVNFKLILDTTKLELGTDFSVFASVFSTSNELNEDDNVINDVIVMAEFSDVEIAG